MDNASCRNGRHCFHDDAQQPREDHADLDHPAAVVLAVMDRVNNLPEAIQRVDCLLYTSPSPRDGLLSRMPSSA